MASIAYHLALRRARFVRWRYRVCLPWLARRPVACPGRIGARLVCFSGQTDLPEQVASLRSFRRFVGNPAQILLVSDGSHTPSARQWLARAFAGIELITWDALKSPAMPKAAAAYAARHPLGKKLVALVSLLRDGPVIYSDSDVLFFPGGAELRARVDQLQRPHYLLDCWPSFDDRLIRDPSERQAPVNSGFLMTLDSPAWSEPLQRLSTLTGDATFFTEQTLVHLAMRAAGGEPLPPDRYVLRNEDQWSPTDAFGKADVVLRHYISSIRYKFWLQVAGTPRTRSVGSTGTGNQTQ